ncbi:hypothetical protein ABPG74_013629 [Tetrahymena malaccensis]
MNGYNFSAFNENPYSIIGQEENQQDSICFNQNRGLFKLSYQTQYSINITSKSTTQQSENESPQDDYQCQFQGSDCQELTQNGYLSSDNDFNQCSQNLDQPDVQSLKDELIFLSGGQQELSENSLYQQPLNNNNNNKNQNLYYCEQNNINYQENINQNYSYQEQSIVCQQFSYQCNRFENQQQQQIHDENHDIRLNPSSINQTEEDYYPSTNQCNLNKNNNYMDDQEDVQLNQTKKLSRTKQRAIQKNKKAYSDQFTCKECDDKSYSDHSGLRNHVKLEHPGRKTSELSKKPNTRLGRPPKSQMNQSNQNY